MVQGWFCYECKVCEPHASSENTTTVQLVPHANLSTSIKPGGGQQHVTMAMHGEGGEDANQEQTFYLHLLTDFQSDWLALALCISCLIQ